MNVVGRAHVLVTPTFTGFQKATRAHMTSAGAAAGTAAGTSMGSAMTQAVTGAARTGGRAAMSAMGSAIRVAGRPVQAAIRTALTGTAAFQAGQQAGAAFTTRLTGAIRGGLLHAQTAVGVFALDAVARVSSIMRSGATTVGAAARTMLSAITPTFVQRAVSGATSFLSSLTTRLRSATGMVTGAVATAFSGVVTSVVAPAARTARSFLSTLGSRLRAGATAVRSTIGTMFAGAGAAGRTAGTAAGTGFVSSMTAALGPLAAIFGGAAVLGGGFNRLANIDDAESRLRGLGYEVTEIESVMESANEAVLGTAYGLDSAASAATGAMGAGVEMGEELTDYLTLIADATTQSTTDFDSMSAILNKVRGDGRLTGETLAQMIDNGLQATPILAEGFGVSIEELRRMVSAGEVSADDFERIMRDRIGGSAQESGNTVRGAMANVRAALSRAGAAILGGEDGFGAVPGFLDKIKNGIDEVTAAINSAWDWIRDNKDTLIPMAQGVLAVVTAFTAWRASIGLVRGALSLLAAHPILIALMAIGAAVGYLWATNEGFREAVTAAWENISAKVSEAWENTIKPALSAFWDWVQNTLAPALLSFWQDTVVPAWDAISSAVQTAWNDYISPALGALWRFIIDTLAPAISNFWTGTIQPAWQGISSAISDAWTNIISPVLTRLWAFIQDTLIPVVMSLWQNVILPAFEAIGAIISTAWNHVISPVLSALWGFINDTLAPVFFWLWDEVIGPVFGWIGDRITSIWEDVVRPVFHAIRDFAQGDLPDAFRNLWDAVKNIFGWIGETIMSAMRTPINWVIRVPWNQGVVRVVNAAANAIGLDWRMDEASEVGAPPPVSTGARGVGAAVGSSRAFAKGGYAPPGWALVGEEGPEFIDLRTPGRVYTAEQTAAMSAAIRGEDLTDRESRAAAGASPRSALLPMGPLDGVGDVIDRIGRGAGEAVGEAVQWVRGGLAAAASAVLDPFRSLIRGTVGQWGSIGGLLGDIGIKVIDDVIAWVRGDDEEYLARQLSTMGGDNYDFGKASAGGWVRPGPGPVTSRFGPRWGGHHSGIDLAMPVGTPLYAPRSGRVIRAGWNTLAGRTGIGLMMQHDGWGSYFGHLSSVLLKAGQTFQAGQVVALSGNTGRSTGPHLHFEVNRGNFQAPINPAVTGLFDEGGVLSHGRMALNMSGKPEAVLTNEQWRSLEQFANTGLPDEVTLVLADGEAFPAFIRRESYGETRAHERVGGAW